MKKRNLFKSLALRIKKAYLTPTLPQHILDIQNHPLTRIFRVIGGLSCSLIIFKYANYFDNNYIFYIAFFFVIWFVIYQIFINYFRIKHMRHILKSGELDIRNSPLDKLASIAGKVLFCIKGSCDVFVPVSTLITVMVGTDHFLESSG